MLTNFYIDAFNLYYGCLKGTSYKWLNLESLCHLSFPSDQVHRIRYFTARVKARPSDPQQPVRQAAYLRALATLPCISIHYGHYLQSIVAMPYAKPPAKGPSTVQVLKSEEKGSDVNLATMLLVDAFDRDFEKAVVVSNDGDLALPVEIVQKKFSLPVIVLFPCGPGRKLSYYLSQVATASPIISTANLAASQFSATLTDAVGTIHKPATW
jgi:NYN domain